MINSSKSKSNDSFESLSLNSNIKQLSLNMKSVDQISLTPSAIQKLSLIINMSQSDQKSAFVDAFDYKDGDNCKKSKLIGSIPNDIPGVKETLSHVHVSLLKNNTN